MNKFHSRGKGSSRFLTVYKKEGSTIMQSDASLRLSQASKECAAKLFASYPLTNKERQELLPPSDKERSPYATGDGRQHNRDFQSRCFSAS